MEPLSKAKWKDTRGSRLAALQTKTPAIHPDPKRGHKRRIPSQGNALTIGGEANGVASEGKTVHRKKGGKTQRKIRTVGSRSGGRSHARVHEKKKVSSRSEEVEKRARGKCHRRRVGQSLNRYTRNEKTKDQGRQPSASMPGKKNKNERRGRFAVGGQAENPQGLARKATPNSKAGGSGGRGRVERPSTNRRSPSWVNE